MISIMSLGEKDLWAESASSMDQVSNPTSPLKIALTSPPSQLHPLFATDANSQNLNRLLHLSLLDVSPSMKFECRLCQSFSHRVEKGRHHFRFQLKKEQTFWDGSPVTAEDVENSVKYFTSEESAFQSVFRFAFKAIEEVKVHGPFEVELIFKNFNLENFSNLPLLKIIKIKPAFISEQKVNPTKVLGIEHILGAGPYQLGKMSELMIELIPVEKSLRPLQFKIVKDETTLALKLINQEIDLSLAELTPRKLFWLQKKYPQDIQTFKTAGTNLIYIGVNHKKKILSDVKVRQALTYLIPKNDLIHFKMKETVTAADSLLSPAFGLNFSLPTDQATNKTTNQAINEKSQKEKVELARQWLDQAGYKKDKKGHRFELNWRLSNNKLAIEVAETIKSYLEKEGIIIHLVIQEWGTFYRGFKNGEYDLVSASWIGLSGPEMLRSVFHSDQFAPQGLNRGFYQNKDFEPVIDQATAEIDEEKRNSLYKKAMEIVKKDIPYLYLWHPNIIWVGGKKIKEEMKGQELKLYPNGSFYPLLQLAQLKDQKN